MNHAPKWPTEFRRHVAPSHALPRRYTCCIRAHMYLWVWNNARSWPSVAHASQKQTHSHTGPMKLSPFPPVPSSPAPHHLTYRTVVLMNAPIYMYIQTSMTRLWRYTAVEPHRDILHMHKVVRSRLHRCLFCCGHKNLPSIFIHYSQLLALYLYIVIIINHYMIVFP